jgi:hypothetical protein
LTNSESLFAPLTELRRQQQRQQQAAAAAAAVAATATDGNSTIAARLPIGHDAPSMLFDSLLEVAFLHARWLTRFISLLPPFMAWTTC